MKLRDATDLRSGRRSLFDAFPLIGDASEQWLYQEHLAREIVQTEQEQAIENTQIRKGHLRSVRSYGDALAHLNLSTYAIRQLARNPGTSPSLSSQGTAFQLTMDCGKAVSSEGVPVVIADLTNALKVGDLIVCTDRDAPQLIECKLQKAKDARFARQGRRGRQLARMEHIMRFFLAGRGVLLGEEHERRTIELSATRDFNYPMIDQIVSSALDDRPMLLCFSKNELLSAAICGEEHDDTATIQSWASAGDRIATGSSLDAIDGCCPDVSPPIIWDLLPGVRWALMEGDVAVIHALKIGAFLGMERGRARICSIVDMTGPPPWGYKITVGEDVLVVSPNLLREVIYLHQTIDSAAESVLELAEKYFAEGFYRQ